MNNCFAEETFSFLRSNMISIRKLNQLLCIFWLIVLPIWWLWNAGLLLIIISSLVYVGISFIVVCLNGNPAEPAQLPDIPDEPKLDKRSECKVD
jgi:hypothetical protein